MEKTVSVILPIYNVEKYLARCVDSLLAQTYPQIELLLVDDGSTDTSGAIADAYGKREERIRVLHKQNGGLSDARNAGIEAATGDYLWFVDSDDWVEPDAVENMLRAAEAYDCDLVMSGYSLDYANEGYSVSFTIEREQTFFTKEELAEGIYAMEQKNFNVVWNKLYAAQRLRESGLRFEPDGMPGEDLLFNCAFLQTEPRLCLITAQTYHYMRQDEDSLAGKYRKNLPEQVARFHEARRQMYDHFGMTEGKYEEHYAHTFAHYVFTCVPNLYKPKARLPRRERRAELRRILNTPGLGEQLKKLRRKSSYLKLLNWLYCLRGSFLSFWLAELLFAFRYRADGFYKKIRKKLNKT